MTFADKIIFFLKELEFTGKLPPDIRIMNPFRENPLVMPLVGQFYSKFYSDNNPRHLLIGINPGRFGAGTTGIPFTDTKRLREKCGLTIEGINTFEPSSVFIYDMIDEFGGVQEFYSKFYITAVSPLGFTKLGKSEKHVNYNYYDSRELQEAVMPFIRESLEKQLDFGIIRNAGFCIGTGKNFKFLSELNEKYGYFRKMVPLEHPRFIMQYKAKQKGAYISKYVEELKKAKG
jgi:hypothetical protein